MALPKKKAPPLIILAYGMPGSGKSTLLHDLVATQASTHRFFVVDHEAGWGPDGIHWRGRPPPIELVEGEEALAQWEGLPARDWPPSGVWTFRNVETERVAQLALAKGDVVFVDDELDLIGRRKGWDDSSLRRVVHEGRHLPNEDGDICELHILGACRRPQNLHTDLTDLASEVYVFRCQGSRTLQRLLADSLIEDGEWDAIRTLPNFHFRHWPSEQYLSVKPVGAPSSPASPAKKNATGKPLP